MIPFMHVFKWFYVHMFQYYIAQVIVLTNILSFLPSSAGLGHRSIKVSLQEDMESFPMLLVAPHILRILPLLYSSYDINYVYMTFLFPLLF